MRSLESSHNFARTKIFFKFYSLKHAKGGKNYDFFIS